MPGVAFGATCISSSGEAVRVACRRQTRPRLEKGLAVSTANPFDFLRLVARPLLMRPGPYRGRCPMRSEWRP